MRVHSSYWWKPTPNTRILRDPYTNKPFVGFYTTKRTGGMLVDSQAIKLMKIGAATRQKAAA